MDWFYSPLTNWQHFFSPTVNFGCNVEDFPTEQTVLNHVGSYGKQINRLNDIVSVLVAHLNVPLTPEEHQFIDKFNSMARAADKAAAAVQHKAQHAIVDTDVEEMVRRIAALANSEPEHYKKLLGIVKELPPAKE
jgi:hypothetical protein